jgi:hypothetical protein
MDRKRDRKERTTDGNNVAGDLHGRVCVCLHFEGDHTAGGGFCTANLETCSCAEFVAFENFRGAVVLW